MPHFFISNIRSQVPLTADDIEDTGCDHVYDFDGNDLNSDDWLGYLASILSDQPAFQARPSILDHDNHVQPIHDSEPAQPIENHPPIFVSNPTFEATFPQQSGS